MMRKGMELEALKLEQRSPDKGIYRPLKREDAAEHHDVMVTELPSRMIWSRIRVVGLGLQWPPSFRKSSNASVLTIKELTDRMTRVERLFHQLGQTTMTWKF